MQFCSLTLLLSTNSLKNLLREDDGLEKYDCVRVCVWVVIIIIIIINIFFLKSWRRSCVCHSALEVTCMDKESGVPIGKLHDRIQINGFIFTEKDEPSAH